MQHPTNQFKQAIRSGKKQVGLWVSLASEVSADIIASSDYDWAVIDMEHSPNTIPTVMTQLGVFAASATTPIVRPVWNDSVEVKRLLDIGAPGLLFPMVQSVEEAQAAVKAASYPPRGIRGVAGATRATRYGRCKDYFDRVQEETLIILQLETQQALSQATQIAAVEGVDGIFFGPADIAADLGYLGQPNHPAVWEAIMPVAHELADSGMPVGTLVIDGDRAAELLNDCFTFVACGLDSILLARGADALVAGVKAKL